MFNILNNRTLLYYLELYPTAAESLKKLYHELSKAEFRNFNELKQVYGSASLIEDGRVIFNVSGNNYRLIVRISFQNKRMMIKWFGTHKEYDAIDAATIQEPNRSNRH